MAVKYGKKKHRQNNVLYTIVVAFMVCALLMSVVASFYNEAEDEAYEMLHIQTKQIKDDLTLQINSDYENLITMANVAEKLYAEGETYDLMFEAFKPIGLFSRIGILNPDGTFITKDETVDLNDTISFEEETHKGNHITGRTQSYSRPGEEVVRAAVPIQVNRKTVGIIYGIIKIETINERYGEKARDLDAQLFVYDKQDGKFIIDTINEKPGKLEDLKNRIYNDDYTYENLVTTDKGYTSFKSIRTGEDLYVHYSTIEDFDWGIMLAQYENQVFAKTHKISRTLVTSFALGIAVIVGYLWFILIGEKRRSVVTVYSSGIRKLLLEINQQHKNVMEALKSIQELSLSKAVFFLDTDGEDYHYILPSFKDALFSNDERKYFVGELFRYAANLYSINPATIGFMCVKPNKHLIKTNIKLYKFLKAHKINEISFATITDKNNHVSILGTINTKKSRITRELLEDVSVCFSIAIYNKNHLSRTETAAVTDSLTGVSNRVSYKKDILVLNEEKSEDFSCIYIDVNELHLRNNKYGHAAGDEMLIYIANTLKEVFFGHGIYRMGGDEFLVLIKNVKQERVKSKIETFIKRLKTTDYNVAIGMSHRTQNTNCEEMVREAELRMYEAKAQYYQNKEQSSVSKDADKSYVQTKTGIAEIDVMLSVLKEHYNGIYRVSLETDNAHGILMPSYLGYNENEEHFSRLLSKYMDETVHPDFHRVVSSFLNYDAIKRQLAEGITPKATYKKMNGETVILSIYSLDGGKENINETLWVFSKG